MCAANSGIWFPCTGISFRYHTFNSRYPFIPTFRILKKLIKWQLGIFWLIVHPNAKQPTVIVNLCYDNSIRCVCVLICLMSKMVVFTFWSSSMHDVIWIGCIQPINIHHGCALIEYVSQCWYMKRKKKAECSTVKANLYCCVKSTP